MFDNIFKVIKQNSGALTANDNVFTEIIDLQLPKGYCARIRRVIFRDHSLTDQTDQARFKFNSALVLDPDDEESYAIPAGEVDHDVLCDYESEYMRFEEDTTPNGISFMPNREVMYDFPEELDAITVRNIRFNTLCTGVAGGQSNPPQIRIEVYFTYEKISSEMLEIMLGIS